METNEINVYSYNYPKGLMDGYVKIHLDSFCRWGKCFKGYGGCADRGPRFDDCEIWDVQKILAEIVKNLEKNPNARFFLETPNFFDPYKMTGENRYQFQEIMDKKIKAYLTIQTTPHDLINLLAHQYEVSIYPKDIRMSGIQEIWMGLESANRELRDKYSKPPFQNEHLLKIVKHLRQADIRCCSYLVVSSDDTDDTIAETVDFIKEMKPDKIFQFDLFHYVAGERYVDYKMMKQRMDDLVRYQEIFKKLEKEINKF
ncbi:MAG: hypothetical protein A3J63_00995 [Candidatus Moranbacteria bacterium RIFCSPHIGHO2_02_FULL_40_12b]|nr:MAG: hypothetical protein A3J63_00995 [Candidatus Moranbacteria bacterium RIFCSPHIGHO2_02_FULL_40_12b]OGI23803.1 MAG: hypothetical protein A3E91_01005 [Candidatus Moranbacteria bacterium RIFCSPHIGHO2_12_FULL_40_10]